MHACLSLGQQQADLSSGMAVTSMQQHGIGSERAAAWAGGPQRSRCSLGAPHLGPAASVPQRGGGGARKSRADAATTRVTAEQIRRIQRVEGAQ